MDAVVPVSTYNASVYLRQLANNYNIQDPILLKQALLQVIIATKDVIYHPWQAVKNAWKASKHELQDGSLQCASQLAIMNLFLVYSLL